MLRKPGPIHLPSGPLSNEDARVCVPHSHQECWMCKDELEWPFFSSLTIINLWPVRCLWKSPGSQIYSDISWVLPHRVPVARQMCRDLHPGQPGCLPSLTFKTNKVLNLDRERWEFSYYVLHKITLWSLCFLDLGAKVWTVPPLLHSVPKVAAAQEVTQSLSLFPDCSNQFALFLYSSLKFFCISFNFHVQITSPSKVILLIFFKKSFWWFLWAPNKI